MSRGPDVQSNMHVWPQVHHNRARRVPGAATARRHAGARRAPGAIQAPCRRQARARRALGVRQARAMLCFRYALNLFLLRCCLFVLCFCSVFCNIVDCFCYIRSIFLLCVCFVLLCFCYVFGLLLFSGYTYTCV